jgi:hypothetical protein
MRPSCAILDQLLNRGEMHSLAWHSKWLPVCIKQPGLEGEDYWIVGGCYEIELRKLNDQWQISALTLARAWAEGNPELPKIAMERATAAGAPDTAA